MAILNCQEKFGYYPNVQFNLLNKDKKDIKFIGIESYLHFIIIELLKNGMKAMIDKF